MPKLPHPRVRNASGLITPAGLPWQRYTSRDGEKRIPLQNATADELEIGLARAAPARQARHAGDLSANDEDANCPPPSATHLEILQAVRPRLRRGVGTAELRGAIEVFYENRADIDLHDASSVGET